MARSREFLLDAAYSHPAKPEDRLTELVASVLDACDPLASELFAAFKLEPCDRYQVFTREEVVPGSKPDMRVNGLSTAGALERRLWCEHKLDARWQPDQVRRYQAAHDAAAGDGKVVCIVKNRPPFDCEFITWQQFAELCDRVGLAWGDRHWRERAAAGDAPARWRMLAELVWYLEEKEKFVLAAPVDETKLEVFSNMVEALRSLAALVENAANRVPGMTHGDWDMEGDGETVTVSFDSPADSWLAIHGDDASADLLVATRDFWSEQQLDEPVVGAGVSLHGRRLFPELAANRAWVDAVTGAGFSCELWDGWGRVYKTRPAGDIISFGHSLDAQAEGVAQWARQAIEDALALDPNKLVNEEDADAASAVVETLSTRDVEDEPPARRSGR